MVKNVQKKLNNNWGSAEENSLWDFPQGGKQNTKCRGGKNRKKSQVRGILW